LAAIAAIAAACGGGTQRPEVAPATRVFDVRAFGARGDGTADDLPMIAAATAAARAAGGGVVAFPAGVYRLDGATPLRLDGDDLTLLGAPGAVIRASRAKQLLLRSEGARRLRIRGLRFEGGAGGTIGVTLQLRGCSDCEISACQFDRIGTAAIDVTEGSSRCRIADNTFHRSPGHSIMISGWTSPTEPALGSSFIEVLDNLIEEPGNSGISIEVRNDHVVVRGNRVLGANQNRALFSDGIAVFNGTQDYLIADNVVSGTLPVPGTTDTGNGILIGHGENRSPPVRGRVQGNLLLSNGHDGRGDVAGCAGGGCLGNGIRVVFPGAGPTYIDTWLEKNVIMDSGRSGISIADAEGITVRGNRVEGSRNQGVWLLPDAGRNLLLGNVVSGSANHGLRIDSSDNTLAGNSTTRNGLSGIFLGDGADENAISGNVALDNDGAAYGHAGVFLAGTDARGASRNVITANRLGDGPSTATPQDYGLRIQAPSCRDNSLAGNVLEGNAVAPMIDEGKGTRTADTLDAAETGSTVCDVAGGAEDPASLPLGCAWARVTGGGALRVLPCDTGAAGRLLHLVCGAELTVDDDAGGNLRLTAPFRCAAGAFLALVCDGESWQEIARGGVP